MSSQFPVPRFGLSFRTVVPNYPGPPFRTVVSNYRLARSFWTAVSDIVPIQLDVVRGREYFAAGSSVNLTKGLTSRPSMGQEMVTAETLDW
jgi:hypothetical protein